MKTTHKSLRVLGGIATVLSLIVCTWLLSGSVAAGFLMHADHYGDAFTAYGGILLGCAGGMTLAVLLCLLRRDLAAVILGAVSYFPTLAVMLQAVNAAETNGWTGQTAQSFGRNAADVWRDGLMWNALPFALILLLSLTHYFSYENRVRRSAAENEPAPSVLGDGE